MGQISPARASLAGELIAAPDVDSRWRILTAALAAIGADQVNYGIIDTSAAERLDAPVRFLSTMAPDWIDYYGGERLDMDDPHVSFVRNGNLAPYRWGESALDRLDNAGAHRAVALTVEAGLRAQISVTMPDPFGTFIPVGGMTVGSSLREREYFRSVAGQELALVAVAHLFHELSIGEVRRGHHHARPLSPRERDCLSYIADGLRPDAIADKLGLARVTVDLYLCNARRKLAAATLPEAVAKGLLFGDIGLR